MSGWAEFTHRSAALYAFRARYVMAPLKRFAALLFGVDLDAYRRYQAQQAEMFGRVLRDATVLELGCGTGFSAKLRARYGVRRYVGTDASPGMVADARRAQSDQAFVAARAEALPFADGAFDVVMSRFLVHHVPPSARLALVREMMRVARRAVVIVDVYGFTGGVWRPIYAFYYRVADGSEYRFTREEWRTFLAGAGVELEESRDCGEATVTHRIGHWVLRESGRSKEPLHA